MNALKNLIELHSNLLEGNPYCYFELAYTRATLWMAWLCSATKATDPNRTILANGQGGTPEEAAKNAWLDYYHRTGRSVDDIDPPTATFDGADYIPERDDARLNNQMTRILEIVRDGQWYTLKQLETLTGFPHASISAQLRHLRKPKFGSHTIERKHLGRGLYTYRLPVSDKTTN